MTARSHQHISFSLLDREMNRLMAPKVLKLPSEYPKRNREALESSYDRYLNLEGNPKLSECSCLRYTTKHKKDVSKELSS